MSYHVTYNHKCPKCGAYYIPFDQAVPCPKCGEVESERFDFIPEAATSANINLIRGRRYVPVAWWVGSLGDHILRIIFGLLDEHRAHTARRAFPVIAAEALARMEWGNQLYFRDHIHAIACRVRDHLDREEAHSNATGNAKKN
jgi:predicted  nucleic acid-binding Zn-ribbon protein